MYPKIEHLSEAGTMYGVSTMLQFPRWMWIAQLHIYVCRIAAKIYVDEKKSVLGCKPHEDHGPRHGHPPNGGID